MDRTYWHKQTANQPLCPDLLWSKPENRQAAGKLLIIGGNSHGFAAPALAYSETVRTGVGSVRVLLPDVLEKTVGHHLPEAFFAPSTPSGGFGQQALAAMLEHATWANAVLVAGDLARNSETAIVLEKFVATTNAPLILTKDAVDYFTRSPQAIAQRPDTTLVLSLAQLQKYASSTHSKRPVTFSMELLNLVDWLHTFSASSTINIIVKHNGTVFVTARGNISTTKTDSDEDMWRVATAAHAIVWWLQNPTQPFEALTSSIIG